MSDAKLILSGLIFHGLLNDPEARALAGEENPADPVQGLVQMSVQLCDDFCELLHGGKQEQVEQPIEERPLVTHEIRKIPETWKDGREVVFSRADGSTTTYKCTSNGLWTMLKTDTTKSLPPITNATLPTLLNFGFVTVSSYD